MSVRALDLADETPATDASVDALLRDARVLVVTPHPDDESLAAGGLIQHARRLGARLRVLQVTDGDNNPWPQRVLERRVVIGAAGRRRWAARRRAEVQVAAGCLGLPVDALQYMGWPDMGVTRRLREQGIAAVEVFASPIRGWRPDVVVLPALGDHHPDHGSSHVLARLALARLRLAPVCLEYLVHGREDPQARPWVLPLGPDVLRRKRDAVLAHRSQVALSRRRLLARVGEGERFHHLPTGPEAALPQSVVLPWCPPAALRGMLHLTLAHADGVLDWPLHRAPLEISRDGQLKLHVMDALRDRRPLFARLDMRVPSPWIFDHWGWRCLTRAAGMPQASA